MQKSNMRCCAHNKYSFQTLSINRMACARELALLHIHFAYFPAHICFCCSVRIECRLVCVCTVQCVHRNRYKQMKNQILNHVDGMEITKPRSPIDLAYTIFSSGFVSFGFLLISFACDCTTRNAEHRVRLHTNPNESRMVRTNTKNHRSAKLPYPPHINQTQPRLQLYKMNAELWRERSEWKERAKRYVKNSLLFLYFFSRASMQLINLDWCSAYFCTSPLSSVCCLSHQSSYLKNFMPIADTCKLSPDSSME